MAACSCCYDLAGLEERVCFHALRCLLPFCARVLLGGGLGRGAWWDWGAGLEACRGRRPLPAIGLLVALGIRAAMGWVATWWLETGLWGCCMIPPPCALRLSCHGHQVCQPQHAHITTQCPQSICMLPHACRGEVVHVETWFQASGKIGAQRDFLFTCKDTGRRLGRATRWAMSIC